MLMIVCHLILSSLSCSHYLVHHHCNEDATGLYEKVGMMVILCHRILSRPSYYHHHHIQHCYHQAAATVSCEDRPNIAAEYMGRAGRLYVRIKKYDDAVSDDW